MPQLQQQKPDDTDMEEAAAAPTSPEGTPISLLVPGSRLRGPQPPPVNPLKFIKVTPPVNLYKAPPPREMPPVVQIRKEEPEDWQNDLEGWKVNRRKRQEQLMERVSEIKKMEEEQYSSSSRRNKTFSEMMRGRKCSIVVYNDGEENDLSDLGIGKKSQDGEESEDGENKEPAKEDEFTFEKAIQNYVEFASSRVSKPVIQTSCITHTSDIQVTCMTGSSECTETEFNETYTVEKKRDDIIDEQAPCNKEQQAARKEDTSPIKPASVSPPSVNETRNSVQEKSSLFEKISVFEKPVEIKTSKVVDSKPLKPKEEILASPTKKTRPPVPAKPKAVTRDEAPSVSLLEASAMETPPTPVWSNMPQSLPESATISVQEAASEVIFNIPTSNSDLRLQQSLVQTRESEPSLVFSDDSSNIDMELSPTSSSAEVPVCNSSLKLMEAPVASNGLDHVSPRDIQRSPLGGEDSGVHTADSVSQSDEVEEEEELPNQANLDMSTGLLSILSSQTPIIDHELSALLAPPSRLEPPREKPPPPPPASLDQDTEAMRKSFLGLEVAATQPAAMAALEAATAENTETDCLGTQLKERLLRLEEEKNNILNMEKHLKAEK